MTVDAACEAVSPDGLPAMMEIDRYNNRFTAFGRIISAMHDPPMKKLMQFVMTDEAFHHRFGNVWADRTVPKLVSNRRKTWMRGSSPRVTDFI